MLSGSHKDKLIPNYLISIFVICCNVLLIPHTFYLNLYKYLQTSKFFTKQMYKKHIVILLGFYSLKCSQCNQMSKNVLWQCFVSFLSAVDLVCRNNWVLKQFILLEKNSKKLNWESDNDDNLSLITQSSRREKIHCIYFWTVSS